MAGADPSVAHTAPPLAAGHTQHPVPRHPKHHCWVQVQAVFLGQPALRPGLALAYFGTLQPAEGSAAGAGPKRTESSNQATRGGIRVSAHCAWAGASSHARPAKQGCARMAKPARLAGTERLVTTPQATQLAWITKGLLAPTTRTDDTTLGFIQCIGHMVDGVLTFSEPAGQASQISNTFTTLNLFYRGSVAPSRELMGSAAPALPSPQQRSWEAFQACSTGHLTHPRYHESIVLGKKDFWPRCHGGLALSSSTNFNIRR